MMGRKILLARLLVIYYRVARIWDHNGVAVVMK
jgi:hypothetical protein